VKSKLQRVPTPLGYGSIGNDMAKEVKPKFTVIQGKPRDFILKDVAGSRNETKIFVMRSKSITSRKQDETTLKRV